MPNLHLPSSTIVAGLACMLLAGCGGSQRAEGDPGGVPVAFTVHVEKAFFSRMADHRTSTSVGTGVGFARGGSAGLGLGLGIGITSTQIHLRGGNQVGGAEAFRHPLDWGDNSFSVPLRPGRILILTVDAEGGREGWESIGSAVIPPVPSTDGTPIAVAIRLDAEGPKIVVTPTVIAGSSTTASPASKSVSP